MPTPESEEAAPTQSVVGTEATAAAAFAASLLAACGPSTGLPEPMRRLDQAIDRPLLLQVPPTAPAPASIRVPTTAELLDWAEQRYPDLFPGPRPTLTEAPYTYRHYPASGNYVGVADGAVYVYGPLAGGGLWRAGSLADFASRVFATRFAVDDAAAARFLLQAQFSATPAEIATLRRGGFDDWLQTQFRAPVGQSGRSWLLSKGYDNLDGRFMFVGQGYPADFMLWQQLFTAPDAMRRRVALALSELFVASAAAASAHNWPQFAIAGYWDLLVEHAFGNFRDLLGAITLNPLMGWFLNTTGNQKEDPDSGRQPDENYAREVMQLFTIGLQQLNPDGTPKRDSRGAPIPTFDQDDVTNLARVFTGYDVDLSAGYLPYIDNTTVRDPEYARKPLVVNVSRHSMLAKNFLGVQVPAGTPPADSLKIALDTLFAHPNVGPFVGRQMIQRLVTSNPSPAYVARVAAAFTDNGQGVRGDLRAMWRAILLDEEARSPDTLADPTFGRLREPMIRFAQWGRSFGARSYGGYWKYAFNPYNGVAELSQQPLRAPSVFNFFRPGYVPPGTAMAATGATAPEFQIVNESTVCSWINFVCSFVFGGVHASSDRSVAVAGDLAPTTNSGAEISVDHSAEIALMPDWPALVQRLNLMLCAGQLAAETVETIEQQLADLWTHRDFQGPNWPRSVIAYALIFVMSAPEYLVQK